MDGNNTYEERNSGHNIGEVRWEQYCDFQGWRLWRLGWDEKRNPVPAFYELNDYLRNLPDYLVITETGKMLVNVKGSANMKEEEFLKIATFISRYTAEKCPLVYAFCLKGQIPILKDASEVQALYRQSTQIDKWPDGKRYRILDIAEAEYEADSGA